MSDMNEMDLTHTLQRYMQAAARLYGLLQVKTLWDIFCWQVKAMSLEEFYTLLKQAVVFCGGVDLVKIGDLLGNEESDPNEDVIADSCLVQTTWDHYFELCMAHEELPVRVFSKDDMLNYSNEDFAPETEENLALAEFLQNRSPHYNGWALAVEAAHQARLDTNAKDCMWELQRMGAVFGDLEDRLRFAKLYRQVFDTTPKQIHNGHTDRDMEELPICNWRKKQRLVAWFCAPSTKDRFLPQDVTELLQDAHCRPESNRKKWWNECWWDSHLPQGLLTPCFCGSGLNFEDCCAKR